MRKNIFTLIELLVVIAIMAITTSNSIKVKFFLNIFQPFLYGTLSRFL